MSFNFQVSILEREGKQRKREEGVKWRRSYLLRSFSFYHNFSRPFQQFSSSFSFSNILLFLFLPSSRCSPLLYFDIRHALDHSIVFLSSMSHAKQFPYKLLLPSLALSLSPSLKKYISPPLYLFFPSLSLPTLLLSPHFFSLSFIPFPPILSLSTASNKV